MKWDVFEAERAMVASSASPTVRLLMFALLMRCGRSPRIKIPLADLARITGQSVRTVQRALKDALELEPKILRAEASAGGAYAFDLSPLMEGGVKLSGGDNLTPPSPDKLSRGGRQIVTPSPDKLSPPPLTNCHPLSTIKEREKKREEEKEARAPVPAPTRDLDGEEGQGEGADAPLSSLSGGASANGVESAEEKRARQMREAAVVMEQMRALARSMSF